MIIALVLGLLTPQAYAAPLEDFLAAAVDHNPDIAAAEARYDRAQAGVDVARSALLPAVSATATYQRNFPEVLLQLPGTDAEVALTPRDQVTGQGRVTVPLIHPAAIASTQAAAAQRRADEDRLTLTTEGLLLQVVAAYYDVLATERVERAAATSQEAATRSLALAQARADLQAASTLDLRRAEADLARAQQTLLAAQARHRDAARALVTLTGLDAPADADVAPRAAPEGDLQRRALDANPQLHAAEEAVAAARLSARAAGLQLSPTVSGLAVLNLTNGTGFSGKPATGYVGAQVSWSLFDGGGREGRWAQARASVREAEATLDGLRAALLDDVAAAEDQLTTASASVAAAQLGLEAAREALRLAEARYALGDLDADALSRARRDAFDAEVQAVSAETARAMAVEQLRMLVGASLRG